MNANDNNKFGRYFVGLLSLINKKKGQTKNLVNLDWLEVKRALPANN